MLSIKVEFYGSFRDYAKEILLSLPDGATIEDVLAEISIRLPETHEKIMKTETTIFVVEGKRVERDYALKEGDVVKFFSSVLGG